MPNRILFYLFYLSNTIYHIILMQKPRTDSWSGTRLSIFIQPLIRFSDKPLVRLTPHVYKLSSIRFRTTVAEISRFAASGITNDCGLSITSSVTIMLRRTGRQCMK